MIFRRRERQSAPSIDDQDELPRVPIWRRTGIVALTGVALVLILIVWMTSNGPKRRPDDQSMQGRSIGVVAPYVPANFPVPKPEPAAQKPPDLPPPPLPPIDLRDIPHPGQKRNLTNDLPGIISYGVAAKETKEHAGGNAADAEPHHTGVDFKAVSIPGVKASPAMDMTKVLMPGLLILALESAIDSNLSGPLIAHLPGEVRSEKGVLLMEAQSRILGSYESFSQNGVKRLKADTAYGWTPNGVMVPLAGNPLADDLGRVGLSGELDMRYLERFGGAILLDIAQSGLSIVQAEVAKGGNTYLSFNHGDSLANQVLQSSINLPPIFKKNQGSLIAMWIKEPISFDESYRLRATSR